MDFDFITLENGLRVIGVPMPMFKTAAVGLWVDSGSVFETAENSGVSHFIEHMLFKGTATRSARRIAEEMDAVGGLLNAFTDRENTCFYTKVVDKHLPLAMDMIADLVLNSVFDEGDIAREKGVVLEEINMSEDTPDDLVFELLTQAHYGVQCVSRPVLGSEETVSALTREAILSYKNRRYRPEGCVLSVAGRYDWNAVVDQTRRLYGAWKNTGLPLKIVETLPYKPEILRREKDIEQVHICLGYNAPSANSPEQYPFSILNTVLGSSMSSRLFQSIREEKGLAYSVYSSVSATESSGLFSIYAGTGPETAEEVVRLINAEVAKLKSGITEQEFIKAREQTLSSIIMAGESVNGRMQSAGRRMLMHGNTLTPDELTARIEAITPEEVNALAAELTVSPKSAALVGPHTDKIRDSVIAGV